MYKRKFLIMSICITLIALIATTWQLSIAQDTDGDEVARRWVGEEYPTTMANPVMSEPCVGGMADIYPCQNVELLSFMPLADIGGGSGNDIWGWTDSLDGKEYALMGRSSGTSFVDISDPENPVYLGDLPSHNGVSSNWRDIKVYADHAFIVSEATGHGIQVFDLTELRSVITPPVTFSETVHFAGFGNAHNIVINEDTGFAYGVGTSTCSGGLHMVNIQNPLSPVDAGCFSDDGYTHDAQCVVYNGPDATHAGREICFNANEDTLTIVDVEDKNNPVQLSRTGYVGANYTHQGWLTENQEYFLLNDELDETGDGVNTTTYIWDVTDLDNPVNIGNYVASNPSSDHNLYILGNLVYESNYRSGLRILDISDVANANLAEIAYFDVYPEDDNAGAGGLGTWSNYPYFSSGVIIVSSIDRGLFMVRPTLEPDFRISAVPDRQDICAPDDAVYALSITQIQNFTDTVTLSANGVPTNATATFSDNPVTPPDSSTFTVGNTGAVAVGQYQIDVVGVATTRTQTATVAFNLYDAAPGVPTLMMPGDGETAVSLTPTFMWSTATQGGDYYLEVATDVNFNTIIYSTTVEVTSHMLSSELETGTDYYWRVQSSNACGQGATSSAFMFTTVAAPNLIYSPPALSATLGLDQAVTQTVTITNSGDLDLDWNLFDLPLGDELFQINVEASTASVVALGVEYVDGHYWITTGGIGSNAEQNYLFELDSDGSLLNTYIQPTVSTWGWRDMAYDGTYLYGSDSNIIEQIDPATGMVTGVTIPSPHNPGRGLAYDPDTDHFWVSNQGAEIYEIDRAGTIINTFPNPVPTASTEIYGLAWDMWSPGGPYLWTWSDLPTQGEVTATQIDPETGLATGVSFEANELDGAAGGATISPDIVPGSLVFAGMQQVGDDTVVAYELSRVVGLGCTTPAEMPQLTVSTTSTTTTGHASTDVDVTFDAFGLPLGVYTGTLCLTSNDPVNDVATIPFAYDVVGAPTADFTADVTMGEAPLTVQFTDASTGTVDGWLWDFGDGMTGTAQHPAHTYTVSGTYTVSLSISGPGGEDTMVKTEYIMVTEPIVEPPPGYTLYLPFATKP